MGTDFNDIKAKITHLYDFGLSIIRRIIVTIKRSAIIKVAFSIYKILVYVTWPFILLKSGNRLNAYIMEVDDITPTIDYIERESADPHRSTYFLFSDYTCGGAARNAFDKSRSYPGRVLSKWADVTGNFIPLPSHIWSAMTHDGNLFGLTGLSPEGNAPCLFTTKIVYRK